MDDFINAIGKLIATLLVPATLYGAGGALMQARRKNKSIQQTLFEVLGGSITANMLAPLLVDATPEKWHHTLFFLSGWGGLELVSRVYEGFEHWLVNKKLGMK